MKKKKPALALNFVIFICCFFYPALPFIHASFSGIAQITLAFPKVCQIAQYVYIELDRAHRENSSLT